MFYAAVSKLLALAVAAVKIGASCKGQAILGCQPEAELRIFRAVLGG